MQHLITTKQFLHTIGIQHFVKIDKVLACVLTCIYDTSG